MSTFFIGNMVVYSINNKDLWKKACDKCIDKPNLHETMLSKWGVEPPFGMLSNTNEWYLRRKLYLQSIHKLLNTTNLDDKISNVLLNNTFKQLQFEIDNNNNNNNNGFLWHPRDSIKHAVLNMIYLALFDKILDKNSVKYKKYCDSFDFVFSNGRVAKVATLLPKVVADTLFPTIVKDFASAFGTASNLAKNECIDTLNKVKAKEIKQSKETRISESLIETVYSKYSTIASEIGTETENSIIPDFVDCDDSWQSKTVADLMVLLLTGYGPTSYAIEFALLLAAKYPKIQQTVYNELSHIFKNDQFSISQMYQLPVFRAFISEVLRVGCPITSAGFRTTRKNIRCVKLKDNNGTYFVDFEDARIWESQLFQKEIESKSSNIEYDLIIKKDSWILANLQHWMTNDKSLWNLDNDPQMVNLNYWLINDDKNNGQLKYVNNLNSLPFSTGIRDCVGKEIALKQIQGFLGHLMLKYKIIPEKGDNGKMEEMKVTVTNGITNTFENEIPIRLIARKNKTQKYDTNVRSL